MSKSVFKIGPSDHLNSKIFFDAPVSIARYDVVKYPFFDELAEKQAGFFWRPKEVDCKKDGHDFRSLSPAEQRIFTSNLKRQILLDSIQGRAPIATFGEVVSLPEIEEWLNIWQYFERIHSRSYTHIIRGIYSNPSVIFDALLDIPEIVDCAKDISKHYDSLGNFESGSFSVYDHKKALWRALNSVNALEGIRFYVSFACSWAFAELKKMEGNAKIIKFIARDENLHLAGTQQLLKLLPKEDEEFARIKVEMEEIITQDFIEVVEQEKAWADYLFQEGSMIGLNAEVLKSYVEWIANKRMSTIGLKSPYKGGTNPLPWTQKWIGGADMQPAPQEVTLSAYTVGDLKKNVDLDSLRKMKL